MPSDAQARSEIVRYGSLLWERGLVAGTSGNISVRLDAQRAIVTPRRRALRNLCEDDLVAVHIGAEDDAVTATTELPLHLAAYRASAQIHAVIHTHPTACVAWSKTGRVFARDTVGARETLGEVAWNAYAPPGSQLLADLAAGAFAAGIRTVLMERHGLCVAAASLEEAFVLTELAEEAAKIAILSRIATGG